MTPTGIAPWRKAWSRMTDPSWLSVRLNTAELFPASDGVLAPRMEVTASRAPGGGVGAVVPPPPCRFSTATWTVPSSKGTTLNRGAPSLSLEAALRSRCSTSGSSRSSTSIIRKPPPLTPPSATAGR
jgi:hypothetical protein